MTGNGIYNYVNGESYEGELEDGKRHGKGKLKFRNNDEFDGNWQNRCYGQILVFHHGFCKFCDASMLLLRRHAHSNRGAAYIAGRIITRPPSTSGVAKQRGAHNAIWCEAARRGAG